jgi:hypothetical protein
MPCVRASSTFLITSSSSAGSATSAGSCRRVRLNACVAACQLSRPGSIAAPLTWRRSASSAGTEATRPREARDVLLPGSRILLELSTPSLRRGPTAGIEAAGIRGCGWPHSARRAPGAVGAAGANRAQNRHRRVHRTPVASAVGVRGNTPTLWVGAAGWPAAGARLYARRKASTARTRRWCSESALSRSFPKMDVTCFSTARSVTTRRSAIAMFDSPSAISPSTSRSRGVS